MRRRTAWECRRSRRAAIYDIEIDSADAAGFQATATAKGGQADDTHCASFTIDQAGRQVGHQHGLLVALRVGLQGRWRERATAQG